MFKPLGDSALLVELGDRIDPGLNRRVHAFNALLQAERIPGLLDTVPAYSTLLIHYDPLALTYAQVKAWAQELFARVDASPVREARTIEVPVTYDGPDLQGAAQALGLSIPEVIRLHSGREYTVFMMGFTPGFPYLGTLDERLVLPRLETPRTLVKAGSVAIAGAQTGIYPLDSPGGWRLIGRTPLRLFDPFSAVPFLFFPGDRVRFIPETE